jgi:hypothetical protein
MRYFWPSAHTVPAAAENAPTGHRGRAQGAGRFLRHLLLELVLISGRLSASLNLGFLQKSGILASRFHEVVQKNILDGATIPPIKNYSRICTLFRTAPPA